MKKTLYLECYAGISGDMTVAALLDLGADVEVLEKVLASLPVRGFRISVGRVKKAGLDACDFAVLLDAAYENHDHDMAYLHGKPAEACHMPGEPGREPGHAQEPGHMQEHEHVQEPGHAHDHGCMQEYGHMQEHGHVQEHGCMQEHHHEHPHQHRGLAEILAVLEGTQMTPRARELAKKIFSILAQAEAKAHGVPAEEVHFHEVGAVDSIVDIVAAAVCLDNLGIEEVIVPVLYEGTGYIRCQHGMIPVPVPAVVNIAADHGLRLHITETEGEFVTPTGAAIVAAVRTGDRLPEQFSVIKTGLGAGKRNYERPSLLRAMLIQENSGDKKGEAFSQQDMDTREGSDDETRAPRAAADHICKLECNVDDCSGEALGYAMSRLLQNGARDVHYTPVFMKKNRPGYQLNVICKKEDVPKLERIIFEETTTIGIRRMEMERTVLQREIRKVQTCLGEARVKVCLLEGKERCYPEYDAVVELCRAGHMPFEEVYRIVLEAAQNEQL